MSAVTPVASGITSHSGTYTPEIWSAKTLVKFYTATVFGSISNTDYEGEIKNSGDTVQIRTVPDIIIRDYSIGQKLVRTRPAPSKISLYIDKGKYYSVPINDVEKLQSDINYVDKWTDDAGRQMAIEIDTTVLEDVYADASSYNSGNTAGYKTSSFQLGASGFPVVVDKDDIIDYIIDMGTVLDEYDVPDDGKRWITFPAAFCGLIKKSDLKDASLAGDGTSIARNGRIGMVDRFEIFRSNQLALTTDGGNSVTNCIFGHPAAITFASQLTENRYIDNPDDFGKIMEGLQVYGFKVIKEQALGHFYARK
jgi:hypothetical protein